MRKSIELYIRQLEASCDRLRRQGKWAEVEKLDDQLDRLRGISVLCDEETSRILLKLAFLLLRTLGSGLLIPSEVARLAALYGKVKRKVARR